METESTKTTGAQGEAKTGKKEGSFMERCMSCCGDPSKMEDMAKMMKDCCGDPSKIKDMSKMTRDCCGGMNIPDDQPKKPMECCK